MWNSLLALALVMAFGVRIAAGQHESDPAQAGESTVKSEKAVEEERTGDERRLSIADHIFVRVDTNLPEAVLFADSLRIGVVIPELVAVPASTDKLRLTAPDLDAWSVPPVERELDARAGDTVEVTLNFPYHYRIESIPYDAGVYLESNDAMRRIGSTPLLYTSERPVQTRFVVERPGYAMVRVEPGTEVWNRHVISLSPSDDLDPTAAQVHWKPPKKHRAWIDYAAIATALAAGAVAVHYKFKADDLYEEYEQSGDRSLRPQIQSFDVRSGVALGVMQVGVGVFAIRLALR